MSTDYSFLFPKKFSPNANLLYSTRFSGVTLVTAPDKWSAHDAWRRFQGTDTLTGFSIADLATLPFGCRPQGGSSANQGGFAVYCISHLADPAADFITGSQTEWDSFFGSVIAPVTFEGVSTNAISLNIKDTGPAAGFLSQQWVHFYRDLTISGIADLPEMCYEFVMSLPDLATKLTTSNKYFTLWDVKTGLPGDQRFTFGIKMAAGQYEDNGMTGSPSSGKLVWYTQSDSRGSIGAGADIPAGEDYFRYINNTVDVPLVDELFKLRIYVKRSTVWSDQSGRVRIELIKADGSKYVLFDCTEGFAAAWNTAHPASGTDGVAVINALNITMGKFFRKTERIYIGNYFGGNANENITSKIAAIDLWDGYPDVLPPPAL